MKRIDEGIKTWIIKDESGCSALKNKKSNVFFRLSVVKSSFPCSDTPIFLLESWSCHTQYMCINIRAFQKYHKYHVSGSRTKNYKKKETWYTQGRRISRLPCFSCWVFFRIQLNQLAWLFFFPPFLPRIDPGSARWVPNFLMSLASPLKVWDVMIWLLMAGNQKSQRANQLGWCENLANRGIFS